MATSRLASFLLFLSLSTALYAQERGMKVPTSESVGERRVALVIGNGAYNNAPLRNPVNDARAMASTLRALGFEVVEKVNANQEQMETAIREFGDRLRRGGVGLFYYAGHGVQVNGSNYLIPINSDIQKETEVKYKSVDAELVLAQMDEARNRVNIVVLDACRNNPFARSWRSITNGLATVDAPKGTIISYATAPAKVAHDGNLGNGLYTERLLHYMKMPGLTLEEVFKRVRRDVEAKTDEAQTPWELSSLTGDFYFVRGNGKAEVAEDAVPYKNDDSKKKVDLPSVSNSVGMEFVLVQPGTFQMGSDENNDENPIHSVTISKPLSVGKYEVTQAQWVAVMGTNPSRFKGDDHPVEWVSWNDAQEFIRKLNQKENTNKYRLPTEAEWEFAARGGIVSRGFRFSGSNNVVDVAVYTDNAGGETKPVGSKQPNELGIFDMSGNVWEWCADWSGPYANASLTDPAGPSSGQHRVFRGGSWDGGVAFCRSTLRNAGPPDLRRNSYGFRLVQDLK